MSKYNIWVEGYLVSGMEGRPQGASFVASVEAESFSEACKKFYKNDPLFNEEHLTNWGCQLYDNEAEARKSFG